MCPEKASHQSVHRRPPTGQWDFLESESDACAIFSRKMEVLYLNRAARPLVSPDWLGRRCWEAFPVAEADCASRCPAVRAVRAENEIVYCDESLRAGGESLTFGVAIIPLDSVDSDGGKALILLRPKSARSDDRLFREECLGEARALRARVNETLNRGA